MIQKTQSDSMISTSFKYPHGFVNIHTVIHENYPSKQ